LTNDQSGDQGGVPCDWCLKSFYRTYPRSKYCSQSCYKEARTHLTSRKTAIRRLADRLSLSMEATTALTNAQKWTCICCQAPFPVRPATRRGRPQMRAAFQGGHPVLLCPECYRATRWWAYLQKVASNTRWTPPTKEAMIAALCLVVPIEPPRRRPPTEGP